MNSVTWIPTQNNRNEGVLFAGQNFASSPSIENDIMLLFYMN